MTRNDELVNSGYTNFHPSTTSKIVGSLPESLDRFVRKLPCVDATEIIIFLNSYTPERDNNADLVQVALRLESLADFFSISFVSQQCCCKNSPACAIHPSWSSSSSRLLSDKPTSHVDGAVAPKPTAKHSAICPTAIWHEDCGMLVQLPCCNYKQTRHKLPTGHTSAKL